MLEFSPVTINDKPIIDRCVLQQNSRSADFNFGNIYIWNKHYRQLYTEYSGRVITRLRNHDHPSFAFPVGSGDLKTSIDALIEYCAQVSYPLVLFGVEEENVHELMRLYPSKFIYEYNEAQSDYIYLAEKLATFSGKALHQKKNHCNRFEAENPSWSFRPITRDTIPACLDMLEHWIEQNDDRLDRSIVYEHDAIVRAFAAYESLGLEGGALYIEDRLVGFTVGEMISSDCFDVHFEKAFPEINGGYTMVCREFCRQLLEAHPSLIYINREDDMGLESLRRSKQSYKPEYLLKKFTAIMPRV